MILHNIPPCHLNDLTSAIFKILDFSPFPTAQKCAPTQILRLHKNSQNTNNYFELVRVVFPNPSVQHLFIINFNANLDILDSMFFKSLLN